MFKTGKHAHYPCFPLVGVAILTVAIGLYMFSSTSFLPWLRYRSISDWYPQPAVVRVAIRADSSYGLRVVPASTQWRLAVTHLGDTMKFYRYTESYFLEEPLVLTGLDTSIVSLAHATLLPKRIGQTVGVLNLRFMTDSLFLYVTLHKGSLIISGGNAYAH